MTVAIGVELIALGALASFIGLGGAATPLGPFRSGWLDVPNSFAPFWFAACLLGGAMVFLAYEPRLSKSLLLVIALAGMAVSGAPIASEYIARAVEALRPAGKAPPLTILTFNTFEKNFLGGRAISVIRWSGADVVAIQEPRNIRTRLPQLLDVYPYQSSCPDEMCSVVILAKRKPEQMKVSRLPGTQIPGGSYKRDGEVVLARIDFIAPDGQPATLVTTHLGWPTPPVPKAMQQELLTRYVKSLPDKRRLILTGDFNLTPWAFAMHRQDAAMRPLRRITRGLATWPAYVPRLYIKNPLVFLPIDHVYVGPEWRLRAVRRLERAGSDHLPVKVELTSR